MKDKRPTTVTKQDAIIILYIVLALIAAASIDPLTDAFANLLTN